MRSLRPPSLELPLRHDYATLDVILKIVDNYGELWPLSAPATFGAQLHGAAVFVDEDGFVASGNISSDTLTIAGGEGHWIQIHLASGEAATLTLSFAAEALRVDAAVSLKSALGSKRRLCEALDADAATCARLGSIFTTGGDGAAAGGVSGDDELLAWLEVADATAVGGKALASASPMNNQHSCLGFNVHLLRDEVLSFNWRVSAQAGDALRLWVDGASGEADAIDGDSGSWRQHSAALSAGAHRILWCYVKNADGKDGSDAGWLDRVRLGPSVPSRLELRPVAETTQAPLTQTQPFMPVTATLSVRLFDQFERPIPLDALSEADFPLQIRIGRQGVARAFLRPASIAAASIADGALFHRIDLSVDPPLNDDALQSIVVATAVGGAAALSSNAVPLKPASPQAFKRAFCEAVGLGAADCALIADIHSSGDSSWHLDDAGSLRSGEVGELQNSCLHVRVNSDAASIAVIDMAAGKSRFDNIGLVFRHSNLRRSVLSSMHPDAGLNRVFSHRETLEAGEVDVSWCYEDGHVRAILQPSVEVQVGILHRLRLLKLARLEVETPLRLEMSSQGEAAIKLRLHAFDDDDAVWPLGFTANLHAELAGGAMFVDAAGNELGGALDETLRTMSGDVHSLVRVRLTGAEAATLTLSVATDGVTPTVASIRLRARSASASNFCRALDITDANCARFSGFFTSGGSGAPVGAEANLGWSDDSVVADALGDSALKSADPDDGEHSCVGFDVHLLEDETLRFSWQVSSQAGDALRLHIDSTSVSSIEGLGDGWSVLSQRLSAGARQVRWCYEKDGAGTGGNDVGWLDNVRLRPARRELMLNLAHDATSFTLAQVPFAPLEATLTLSLFDEFGAALPLSNLDEASFPLKVQADLPGALFPANVVDWSPKSIAMSDIAAGALSWPFNFVLNSGLAQKIDPFRFVVTDAAGALISSPLWIELASSPQVVNRAFCDAVGVDAADCAFITLILEGPSWHIGEDGAFRSGMHTGSSRDGSCLIIDTNIPAPRALDMMMEVSIEPDRFVGAGNFHIRDGAGRTLGNVYDSGNYSYRWLWPAGPREIITCLDGFPDFGKTELSDFAKLRRLRFLKFQRLAIDAPERLALSSGDDPVVISTSLRALDQYDGIWDGGFSASLRAELTGAAVFVDAEGNDAGRILTDQISVAADESEAMVSFRVRGIGGAGTALTLRVEPDEALPSSATVNLPAASTDIVQMCRALDVTADDCARLGNYFSGGGDGAVMAGVAETGADLAWSAVASTLAVGFSALRTPAVVGDGRHACLGFDIYLDARKQLSFDWRVSTQMPNVLRLWIDGANVAEIGDVDGQRRRHSTPLAAGEHRLRWCYEKVETPVATPGASDVAWLDNLRLAPPQQLLLSHVGTMTRGIEAFKPSSVTLTLQLLDDSGTAIPLSSLDEGRFPVQIKIVSPHGELAPWSPRSIAYSEVSGGGRSHQFDLNVDAFRYDAMALLVVARTARLSGATLTSNPLSLSVPTPSVSRQAFCAAVELDAADCASITLIEFSGKALWRIDEQGLSQNAAPELGDREQACLHVHTSFPAARRIDMDMGIIEGRVFLPDELNFLLDDVQQRMINGVADLVHQQNFPAGARKLSWCYLQLQDAYRRNSIGQLRRLNFSELERFDIKVSSRLDVASSSTVVEIPMSLTALDDAGELWELGFVATMTASVTGDAVFVDAVGDDIGDTIVETISIQAGRTEARLSLRARLSGPEAELALSFSAAGIIPSVTSLSLGARSESKKGWCSALDIVEANCARFDDFFTSGGAGGATAGAAGGNAALAWSAVIDADAVGGFALKTPTVGDSQHSCLGFDVRLFEPEVLSFDWRASSQALDALRLWVDGRSRVADVIDGDDGWYGHSRPLQAGLRRIRWCYEKDAAGVGGADAVWLDNVGLGPDKKLVLSAARSVRPEAFKTTRLPLTLRLLDGAGDPLPLSNLPRADFPIRIEVNAPYLNEAIWEPRAIDFWEIADGALSHEIDLSVQLDIVSTSAPFEIVAKTAMSAQRPLSSNPVLLRPAQYKKGFCDAVGLNDADCDSIVALEFRDQGYWHIDEDGSLRSAFVDEGRTSCLFASFEFPEARMLMARMGLSHRTISGDPLFSLELNGGRVVFRTLPYFDPLLDDSSKWFDFSHREALPAGRAELQWCYSLPRVSIDGLSGARLLGVRFLKFDRLAIAAPTQMSAQEPLEILDIEVESQALDNYGDIWSLDTSATLVFELEGEAEFVDADGEAIDGLASSLEIAIEAGRAVTPLRARLTSATDAVLMLTLEAEGYPAAMATVRLRAAQRILRTFEIEAFEVTAPEALEAFEVTATLVARDNYGGPWSGAATLEATLGGEAQFVNNIDVDSGRAIMRAMTFTAGMARTILRARLTSSTDAVLHLTVRADGVMASTAVNLIATPRQLQSLEIIAQGEEMASVAREAFEVDLVLRALDNYNDPWPEVVTATLNFELQGEAKFTDDDASGSPDTMLEREVIIESGFAMTSVQPELSSVDNATLTLTASADGATSAEAVVSLIAATAALERLEIIAPSEPIAATEVSEILMIEVSLRALDNYSNIWEKDVTATLDAQLSTTTAAFVDAFNAEQGQMQSRSVSIVAGTAVESLRLKLKTAADATLTLTLSAEDATSAVVELSLRAAPRELASLSIDPLPEVEATQARAPFAVNFALRAWDNYGAPWSKVATTTLNFDLQGEAEFTDSDVSDSLVTMLEREVIIESGFAMTSVHPELTSMDNATLTLTASADGVTSVEAVVSLIAVSEMPETLTIEAPTTLTATRAFGTLDVAMMLGARNNYDAPWSGEATLSAELTGGEAAFVENGAEAGTMIERSVAFEDGRSPDLMDLDPPLRVTLKTAENATLSLILRAEGVMASAAVSLRAAPRKLDRLEVSGPPSVSQTTPNMRVRIEFNIVAKDNYDALFETRVALTLNTLGTSLAQASLLGEAFTSPDNFLVTGGEATVIAEVTPPPNVSFEVQLDVSAEEGMTTVRDEFTTRVEGAASVGSRLALEGPSTLALGADGQGRFEITLSAVDADGGFLVGTGVSLHSMLSPEGEMISVTFHLPETGAALALPLDLAAAARDIEIRVDFDSLLDADLVLLAGHAIHSTADLVVRLLRGPQFLDVTADGALDTEDLIAIQRYLLDPQADHSRLLRNLKTTPKMLENLQRLDTEAFDLNDDGMRNVMDIRLLMRYALGLGEALLPAQFDEDKARALLYGE